MRGASNNKTSARRRAARRSEEGRRGFRKVCVGCFDRLYPNEPRLRRNHLFKEKAIRKAIYESSILSDALGRVIWEGGLFPNQSTYLPDMWIDCGTHFVVVEIDEQQVIISLNIRS